MILFSHEVQGVDLDSQTRCAHYHTGRDIIAIKFYCCGTYYSCHRCHQELASHPSQLWPEGTFTQRAILCGACGHELSIADYLSGPHACPACHAPFNPGCATHHHLYFTINSA